MKIDILNSVQSFSWNGVEVPMVPRGFGNKSKTLSSGNDSQILQ